MSLSPQYYFSYLMAGWDFCVFSLHFAGLDESFPETNIQHETCFCYKKEKSFYRYKFLYASFVYTPKIWFWSNLIFQQTFILIYISHLLCVYPIKTFDRKTSLRPNSEFLHTFSRKGSILCRYRKVTGNRGFYRVWQHPWKMSSHQGI